MSFGKASISEVCYNFIRENLTEGKTILELGSGWATGELGKYYNMISIEHDGQWIEQHNSDYIYAPIRLYNESWTKPDIDENDGWYDVDDVKFHLQDKKYDMILVDGPPGWLNSAGPGKTIGRGGFYKHMDLFNTDVPIIIDDIDRAPEMHLLKLVSEKLNRPYIILDDKATGVINA